MLANKSLLPLRALIFVRKSIPTNFRPRFQGIKSRRKGRIRTSHYAESGKFGLLIMRNLRGRWTGRKKVSQWVPKMGNASPFLVRLAPEAPRCPIFGDILQKIQYPDKS